MIIHGKNNDFSIHSYLFLIDFIIRYKYNFIESGPFKSFIISSHLFLIKMPVKTKKKKWKYLAANFYIIGISLQIITKRILNYILCQLNGLLMLFFYF